MRVEQPQVGGNALAALERHQVSRHESRSVDVDELSVAQHRGANLQQLLQAVPLPLRAPFLPTADSRVDEQDHADEPRVADLP